MMPIRIPFKSRFLMPILVLHLIGELRNQGKKLLTSPQEPPIATRRHSDQECPAPGHSVIVPSAIRDLSAEIQAVALALILSNSKDSKDAFTTVGSPRKRVLFPIHPEP
jgi:hypothetical protein